MFQYAPGLLMSDAVRPSRSTLTCETRELAFHFHKTQETSARKPASATRKRKSSNHDHAPKLNRL